MITGCVDTEPFGQEGDSAKKIFIECELISGQHTEAFVSYPTFLNEGLNSFQQVDTNEIKLTLTDVIQGATLTFRYDTKLNKFFIDKNQFPVKSGHIYLLKANFTGSDEEILVHTETPPSFVYDSIQVIQKQFTPLTGGEWSSAFVIRLHYDVKNMVTDKFTHISFFEFGQNDQVSCFSLSQQQNCTVLTHREGLLWFVDKSLETGFIDFRVEYIGPKKTEKLKMRIKNTTESYYQYQKFKSNAPAVPTPLGNPSIAAFNISTKSGYGTFSASVENEVLLEVK